MNEGGGDYKAGKTFFLLYWPLGVWNVSTGKRAVSAVKFAKEFVAVFARTCGIVSLKIRASFVIFFRRLKCFPVKEMFVKVGVRDNAKLDGIPKRVVQLSKADKANYIFLFDLFCEPGYMSLKSCYAWDW